MKTKALTAAQIDTLAPRLCGTDRTRRLLAARIGTDRAALAFAPILTAATAEQAGARLTLELACGNTEPAGEAAPAAEEPKAATAPAIGKRQAIRAQAQTDALPCKTCPIVPPALRPKA